jgi:hypothetical protein
MAILRCTEAFAYTLNGSPDVVRPGDLRDDKDPAVKGHEQWFEPVEVTAARATAAPVVEQATAAPGEARAVSKPRAKK